MKHKCTLKIEYAVIVNADTKEEAEAEIFEIMADEIASGVIPMDMYNPAPGSAQVPMLMTVEVETYGKATQSIFK